jgi:hypothetical protein
MPSHSNIASLQAVLVSVASVLVSEAVSFELDVSELVSSSPVACVSASLPASSAPSSNAGLSF